MKPLAIFLLAFLYLNCDPGKQALTEVTLRVTSSESVQIADESVPLDDLITTLTDMGVDQDTFVTISANPEVTMETVQKIQTLLISKKITKLSFSAG